MLFFNPFEALSLYRSKDIVEKGFGNLKERSNFRRTQTSSELSLNGKLFVEFVTLIYLSCSCVKKKMQDAGLFETWALQGFLDELDTTERFESPEHGRLLGEVTKNRKESIRRQVWNCPRYKFRELRFHQSVREVLRGLKQDPCSPVFPLPKLLLTIVLSSEPRFSRERHRALDVRLY